MRSRLLTVKTYLKMDKVQIDEVVAALAERHPLQTTFPREEKDLPKIERSPGRLGAFSAFLCYEPPTEAEIAEYRDVKYPKWKADLGRWIEAAQRNLVETCRYIPVTFNIANTGNAPLQNCVVEFSAYNGATFCPPETADKLGSLFKIPALPKPPAPPRGEWRELSSMFGGLATLLQHRAILSSIADFNDLAISPLPPHRDKHAFYWIGGRPSQPRTEVAFECEEFRHKVEAEQFDLYLYMPEAHQTEISVRCRVTGTNLPEPIPSYLKIRLEYQERRIIEEITKIVTEVQL